MDTCAAVAGIGFGAVVAAVITSESRGSLTAPGGQLTALGRLAGFTGTYLILIMLCSLRGSPGWNAQWARISSSAGTERSARGPSA